MEWISVKDRLPKPPSGQLCSDDVLVFYSECVKLGYLDGHGGWQIYTMDDDYIFNVVATHWMPLPDGPK